MNLEFFDIPKKFLTVTGIWVTNESSRRFTIYAAFMQIFFLYIWTTLMGVSIVNVESLIEFAVYIAYFVTYFVCVAKSMNLYFKMNELYELFDDLKQCIDEYKLEVKYLSHLIFARKLLFGYWLAAFITSAIGGSVSFYIGQLSYLMWFPYSLDDKRLFYLSASYQFIEPLLYSGANVMMDALPIILIAYLIAMLHHLCDKLENLSHDRDFHAELLICINYQRKIVELTRKTEKIFAKITFFQGFFASTILCTTTYAMASLKMPEDSAPMFKLSTYMMAMIAQIAIPCFYGTRLSLAYGNIIQSIFHSEWIKADRKYRQNLVFFMQNAKRQLRFRAFNFFEIDLQNFMRILNSAYSLYAVFKKAH